MQRIFALVVTASLLVKLWLTSNIRIVPLLYGHDMFNYIEHAKSIAQGQWFGPYDDTTLIKQPFFPIYLAAIRSAGLPLTIAHLLLYAIACLFACRAIRPLLKSQASLSLIFVGLYFNPFTYDLNAWISNRSQVNPSLGLLVIACAFGMFVRRSRSVRDLIPWTIGLAISLPAFWLNREESAWIVPLLAILLGAYVWHVSKAQTQLIPRLMLVLLPVATLAASAFAIMAMNEANYGWFTTLEMTSPEYVSAYNSFARISVPAIPFVPVSTAALAIAYRVSPAARELQPELSVSRWRKYTCLPAGVCSEIATAFFGWAFRDAVAGAGAYTSGATARAFYIKLSNEIDGACSAGKIRCRPKSTSPLPPINIADIPAIAAHFTAGMVNLLTLNDLTIDPAYWTQFAAPPPYARLDYSFVAQSILDRPSTQTFSGWLVHGRVKNITFKGAGERTPVVLGSSPDLKVAFASVKGAGYIALDTSRFRISTSCVADCFLLVTRTDGTSIRIPLSLTPSYLRVPGLLFHLDSIIPDNGPEPADAGFKSTALTAIGIGYKIAFPWLLALSLAVFAFRVFRKMVVPTAPLPDYAVLTTGVLVGSLSLMVVLAIIDTLSFPTFIAEYLGVLYPLMMLQIFVCFSVEGERFQTTWFVKAK
jgi:hypothetical protein